MLPLDFIFFKFIGTRAKGQTYILLQALRELVQLTVLVVPLAQLFWRQVFFFLIYINISLKGRARCKVFHRRLRCMSNMSVKVITIRTPSQYQMYDEGYCLLQLIFQQRPSLPMLALPWLQHLIFIISSQYLVRALVICCCVHGVVLLYFLLGRSCLHWSWMFCQLAKNTKLQLVTSTKKFQRIKMQ